MLRGRLQPVLENRYLGRHKSAAHRRSLRTRESYFLLSFRIMTSQHLPPGLPRVRVSRRIQTRSDGHKAKPKLRLNELVKLLTYNYSANSLQESHRSLSLRCNIPAGC